MRRDIGRSRERPARRLSLLIDALNERLGTLANWLVLIACVISAGNAMMRYAFDMSQQRLARDPVVPVRGDRDARRVVHAPAQRARPRRHPLHAALRARQGRGSTSSAPLFFLIPSCLLIAWLSWPFFYESWHIQEISRQRRRAHPLAGRRSCAARLRCCSRCRASPRSSSAARAALRGLRLALRRRHYERPVQ